MADTDLARYCLQLAWLLESGLPPTTCCRVLSEDAPTPALRAASHTAWAEVRRGLPLGRALLAAGVVSGPAGRVLAAADAAGRLPAALGALAEALTRRAERRRALRAAAVKHLPTALILLAVVVLLSRSVLPVIAGQFGRGGLPPLPMLSALLAALEGLGRAAPTGLVAAAALWAASVLAYDRCKPLLDRTVLALPWLKDLTILSTTARYTWTLGLLLAVGYPAIRALRLAVAAASNTALALRLRRAPRLVERGATVSQALTASRALDPVALSIIRSGERSGRLPEALDRAARAAEQGVDRALAPALHAIPTALALLLGGAVALLGLAVLEPLRVLVAWLERQ